MCPVEEIRRRFEENQLIDKPSQYDYEDLFRLNNDNKYVERFLDHYNNDVDSTYEAMDKIFIWRKLNNLNSFESHDIPCEFFQVGEFITMDTSEPDGIPILYVRMCRHKSMNLWKEWMRKCGVYVFEKMDRYARARNCRYSIVVDLTNGSLSHFADIDVVIDSMRVLLSYYAHSIEYVAIYNMPFILRASVNMLKAMLPKRYRSWVRVLSSKKDLLKLIEEKHLPECFGGNNKIIYSLDGSLNSPKLIDFLHQGKITQAMYDQFMKTFGRAIDEFDNWLNTMKDDSRIEMAYMIQS